MPNTHISLLIAGQLAYRDGYPKSVCFSLDGSPDWPIGSFGNHFWGRDIVFPNPALIWMLFRLMASAPKFGHLSQTAWRT
jgi:hypothetical protein